MPDNTDRTAQWNQLAARLTASGVPYAGFTHRGVSYALIQEPDNTFGVWRTDTPGDFMVRGRPSAETAKRDAITDIDAFARLTLQQGPNTA